MRVVLLGSNQLLYYGSQILAKVLVIRERILAVYGIDELENDKVCVLPIDVPSGNLYEYDIEWGEIWREGKIETDPGGEKAGTYRILVDMTCQTIGWRVCECK
jgi:hypothetical protein